MQNDPSKPDEALESDPDEIWDALGVAKIKTILEGKPWRTKNVNLSLGRPRRP